MVKFNKYCKSLVKAGGAPPLFQWFITIALEKGKYKYIKETVSSIKPIKKKKK